MDFRYLLQNPPYRCPFVLPDDSHAGDVRSFKLLDVMRTHTEMANMCLLLFAAVAAAVLSFIAGHTPPEKRALVVSGYLFQVGVLRLAGTSAYPAWAVLLGWLLPGDDDATLLLRDRVTMGVCTFFCFSGAPSTRMSRHPTICPCRRHHHRPSICHQPPPSNGASHCSGGCS